MTASEAAVKRYTEAYRAPASLERAGGCLKCAGGVIGWGTFLVGFGTHDIAGFLMCSIAASFFGLVLYSLGALLDAQGKVLRAALDGAVNTSVFLSESERAEVMSLAPRRAWSPIGLDTLTGVEDTQASHAPQWDLQYPRESPVAALISAAQPVALRHQRRPLRQTRRRLI